MGFQPTRGGHWFIRDLVSLRPLLRVSLFLRRFVLWSTNELSVSDSGPSPHVSNAVNGKRQGDRHPLLCSPPNLDGWYLPIEICWLLIQLRKTSDVQPLLLFTRGFIVHQLLRFFPLGFLLQGPVSWFCRSRRSPSVVFVSVSFVWLLSLDIPDLSALQFRGTVCLAFWISGARKSLPPYNSMYYS